MTFPEPESTNLPPRRRRPSRGPLLLFLLVVAAVLFGIYLLGRPHLEFTNQLAGPVRLVVGEDPPRTIPPRHSARVAMPWGKSVLVRWELMRPLSADGLPMGDELRESILVRPSWGAIGRDATARGGTGDYFAPLITNVSADLLRVTVNAGLEGALDCGCAVRPGGQRAYIGYYHLYQNSTVQARASGGRTASFRDLGPKVLTPDGTVGLRFDSRDLRAR